MSAAGPGAARSVLAERARALARPLERPPEGDELSIVAFSLAGEVFGIDARYVREVVRLRHLATLPGAPPAVRGVTTCRGEIVPAVDVGALVRPRGRGLGDLLWLIVLGTATAELGLLADAISGVAHVRLDGLRALSEDAPPAARRLALGIAAGAATVLDGAALLAEQDLFMTRPTPATERSGDQGREWEQDE